jgi:hypothetical protein
MPLFMEWHFRIQCWIILLTPVLGGVDGNLYFLVPSMNRLNQTEPATFSILTCCAVVLCNNWLEFKETLWESSISRGDAHTVGLFRSDTLTQSYVPWLVMQYAYSKNRFRATSLQLPAGIQGNFMGTFNTKRRCAYRRLVPVRNFNSELWPIISYAYRVKIVSVLLLCNYWLEFKESLKG